MRCNAIENTIECYKMLYMFKSKLGCSLDLFSCALPDCMLTKKTKNTQKNTTSAPKSTPKKP